MPLHFRCDGEIAILSNVGRLMNDPRYFDAGQQVKELLSEGFRTFIIELRGVGETGSPLLGLLMTMTRQIRKDGGEVVLAGVSRSMEKFLDEMRMEEFWDVFRSVEEAKWHFVGQNDTQRTGQGRSPR
jgi:anti-sigma B factor antagonist